MDSMTAKRRALIVEKLGRQELVKVTDLSQSFGVSEVSIRRDIRHLEAQGLLRRVHGGAIPVANSHLGEAVPNIDDPQAQKKERIGQAAAALIVSGDRLIFDSGTTPLQVAAHIPADLLNDGHLTVVTACLPIVRQLGAHKGLHMIVLGGIYLPEFEMMVGPQAIESLKTLHADKMFLGTDGLSVSHGLTVNNILEAELDQALVKASKEVIVVANSSKIGGAGLATIMPLSRIDRLVTDTDAPPDFVAYLREQGVDVILV